MRVSVRASVSNRAARFRTGLVVGETAVIGDDVSILHEVTLGGTGKERGDRHPKVRDEDPNDARGLRSDELSAAGAADR
jgi:serine acetyltransferase